jgi:predicted amidophosphoribosyltransferase
MSLHSVQSLYFFQPKSIEQRAIHELKYKKNMQIGNFFGKEMGKRLVKTPWLLDVDLLVPIPLHRNKELERGYNQSRVLCEGISEETKRRKRRYQRKSHGTHEQPENRISNRK